MQNLKDADMVVFASPIYWFDITAQLKAVIDRLYVGATAGFHFHKTALLLDAGADHVFDAAIEQYRATAAYVKWENCGIITVPNMESKRQHECLSEADRGRSIGRVFIMQKYRHIVQYYETDKMGITHHSNYIRWMEEARIDFLRQIGWDYAKLESIGIISPVIAVNCKYKKSTTFEDVMTLTS